MEEGDVSEVAAPFARQTSPDCRLVDCSAPCPRMGNELDDTRMSFKEFQSQATALANEFFCSRDVGAMVESITGLGCQSFHDELVAMLLRCALDRKNAERQVVVTLLNELEAKAILSKAQLVRGFEKLVLGWGDLHLDVPDAPSMLVGLLSTRVGLLDRSLFARLPEGLLMTLRGSMPDGASKDVLSLHLRQLAAFKAELVTHLETDLFGQRNVDSLAAWLRSAGRPAFHHEVVLAASAMSLDAHPPSPAFWTACMDAQGMLAEKRALVLAMLQQLHSPQEEWVIDEADIQLGFSRLLGSTEQLAQASPEAHKHLVELLTAAIKQEVLSAEFLRSARRMRFGGPIGVELIRKVQRETPMHSRRAWGSGDARQFRSEVRDAVLEYFDARSLDELAQIVDELHLSDKEQAHFLQKMLVIGMEQGQSSVALDAIQGLMGTCWSKDVVQAAFDRLRDIAQDLVLDIPHCREHTTALVAEAVTRNLLDKSYLLLDGTTVV